MVIRKLKNSLSLTTGNDGQEQAAKAVASASTYQQDSAKAGASRIRARGRGAIVQARAIFKKAGAKPPASLRLPTPKRKPK